MGKPKAPKAPDPIETGKAQTGTNVATAIAGQVGNMVDQSTPYGSKTYDQTGTFTFTDPTTGVSYDLPKWTESISLNEDGQYLQDQGVTTQKNLADLAASQSGRLNGLLDQPMDIAGVSQLQKETEKALLSRLSPQMDRDQASLEGRLRQQGITPGSAAWDREMSNMGQIRTDARMQAILGANQERSRALSEEAAIRNQPINEVTALMSGSQVTNPTFGATPGMSLPTTDYAGLINQNYANQMGAYNTQMGNWNGLWGGILGGGAKLISGGLL